MVNTYWESVTKVRYCRKCGARLSLLHGLSPFCNKCKKKPAQRR